MTHSPHQKASTSLSVLQYLAVSTRVLGRKYCSTCKEVLIVTCSVLKKVDRLNLESDIGLHWKSLFLYEFTHYKGAIPAERSDEGSLPKPTDL